MEMVMAAGKLTCWLSRQTVLADAAEFIVVLSGRGVRLKSCRHLRIRQRHRNRIPEPSGNSGGGSRSGSCHRSGDQRI